MSYCLLAENCSVYDKAHHIPGIAVGGPLCHGCKDLARADLNLLRYDYIDLSQLIPKADGRNDSRIFRPKPESSPPVNMSVLTLRGEIAFFVNRVGIAVRRWAGSPQRAVSLPVREGYGLDHDVRYLMAHVDDLVSLPATDAYWSTEVGEPYPMTGPDIVLRVAELHRRSRRLCGVDPRTITVPGHCDDCNTPSLRRHDDDADRVWCLHCKKHLDQDGYLRVVRLQVPVPRNPTD